MSERKHSHYYKDVTHLKEVDVYRVLRLFGVTDPSLAHAIKKLLVAGGRGAGKDIQQDVREAVDSCNRYLELENEDATAFNFNSVDVPLERLKVLANVPRKAPPKRKVTRNGY